MNFELHPLLDALDLPCSKELLPAVLPGAVYSATNLDQTHRFDQSHMSIIMNYKMKTSLVHILDYLSSQGRLIA